MRADVRNTIMSMIDQLRMVIWSIKFGSAAGHAWVNADVVGCCWPSWSPLALLRTEDDPWQSLCLRPVRLSLFQWSGIASPAKIITPRPVLCKKLVRCTVERAVQLLWGHGSSVQSSFIITRPLQIANLCKSARLKTRVAKGESRTHLEGTLDRCGICGMSVQDPEFGWIWMNWLTSLKVSQLCRCNVPCIRFGHNKTNWYLLYPFISYLDSAKGIAHMQNILEPQHLSCSIN